MNLITDKQVRVFRKDYNDKHFYSFQVSKKLANGTYENAYMNCNFKNGVEFENGTDIYIKSAWLSFYKKENQTNWYVFINEFETIGQAIENAKPKETKEEYDAFKDFANEVELTDDDLPF